MILHYIVHVFLGMLFSLKINISFLYPLLLCHLLLLWSFPPLSNSSQIFIQSVLAFNQVLCIRDAPAHSLFWWLTQYLILPHFRFSKFQHLYHLQYVALLECLYLRIGMDFPLLVRAILFQPLLLHCPILIFPHATHMLPSMIVGDKLCRKKLPLQRPITLGTLSPVLPLLFLWVANEFTQSRPDMMEVWIVTTLGLLHLGIIRNMVSIMKRPLLLWLK